MKIVGNWWNDRSIDLVEVDGHVYALYGWNGEAYLHCWECTGYHYMDASEEEFELVPVYTQTDDDDFDIVDYEVRRV